MATDQDQVAPTFGKLIAFFRLVGMAPPLPHCSNVATSPAYPVKQRESHAYRRAQSTAQHNLNKNTVCLSMI
jgi:hypothetical protein